MPPLFILTPASLAWSPLFAGYSSYLAVQVSRQRIRSGHVKCTSPEVKDTPQDKKALHDLEIAQRAHLNFTENVPLAYILISLAEMNGAPTALIHTTLGALFALRVVHVEYGLKAPDTLGRGRIIGTFGTYAIVVLAGLYNFGLAADFVWTELRSMF